MSTAPHLVATVLLTAWLVVIADVDRRTGRIPNALVVPAVLGTVVVAAAVPTVGLSAAVLAVPYAVAFAARAGGGGDVKLALPCGGLLADPAVALIAALVAAGLTLLVCAVTKQSRVRHGPALVASTVLLMVLK